MVDGRIMFEDEHLMPCISWMLEHCDYFEKNKQDEQWVYRGSMHYAHIVRVEEYN
ncbi:MAG: hypothetical protein J6P64_08885 [Bacteroidales bacterium]|nr:hypothetical protein [Bacteroidales bacterium]